MNEEQRALFPKKKNGRLRRGVHLVPATLTTFNLGCGFYAINATMMGGTPNFDKAAIAIGLAVLFDSLDGRIARATGTNSEFGKQFDSLADVISFGIAPGILSYAWGVRSVFGASPALLHNLQPLGLLICFAYVVCCAWRLARFNIQGMAPDSRFFLGMPAPAAAGMVAASVHALKFPLEGWRGSLLWLALVGAIAALMSSTIRYYSGKDLGWTRRQPSLVVVALALLGWSIVEYSEEMLLIIASLYAVSGPTLVLLRGVRHRLASQPTA
ncbi:MAG: phosphatidylcholine/phosphatidylserine synthase [Acidobacteria bacterium]|nr:phosphatidylcholine/phosphatidylserine synthase [Acidobacteriota bacterium]MBI3663748.1 phosphatidylcholine/phosphatidylserine synthase [Acidobacteriota bacterium]